MPLSWLVPVLSVSVLPVPASVLPVPPFSSEAPVSGHLLAELPEALRSIFVYGFEIVVLLVLDHALEFVEVVAEDIKFGQVLFMGEVEDFKAMEDVGEWGGIRVALVREVGDVALLAGDGRTGLRHLPELLPEEMQEGLLRLGLL